jgi:phage terminase small subunit
MKNVAKTTDESEMKKKSTNLSKPNASRSAKKKTPAKQASGEKVVKTRDLTQKERLFCAFYAGNGFNASKAARDAGYSEKTSKEIGCNLLTKINIKNEIAILKEKFEEQVAILGITKQNILAEHAKIAYASMADLHNSWIERKAFEELTPEMKACISELDSKIEPKLVVLPNGASKTIKVEYVRIRLYDKQKSLDSITRIMGWDAPTKTEVSNPDGSLKEAISLSFDVLFPDNKGNGNA